MRVFFWMLLFVLACASAQAQTLGAGDAAPALTVGAWIRPASAPETLIGGARRPFVLIDFWATWCVPCIRAFPHLNALYDEFSDRVAFISMTDEPPSLVEPLLARRELKADVLQDSYYRTHAAFGVQTIPHAVLIGPGGTIRWAGIASALTAEQLRNLTRDVPKPNGQSAHAPHSIRVVEAGLRPYYSVTVEESGEQGGILREGDHMVVMKGQPLRDLLAYLLERPASRVILIGRDQANLPSVDVLIRSSAVLTKEQVRRDVLERLRQMYGLTVAEQTEMQEVWVLTVPSLAALPLYVPLPEDRGVTASMNVSGGEYRGINQPIAAVAPVLERQYNRLIVDESGIGDGLRLTLRLGDWDQVRAELERQHGIVLRAARRPVTLTQVTFD